MYVMIALAVIGLLVLSGNRIVSCISGQSRRQGGQDTKLADTERKEDMKAQAEALPKGDFRFEKALSGKECAFICEVKKASPSKGIIDPVFDFEAIAQSYEDAGADFNAAKMVLSPMVGVFYASPSPSDPPFVTVGSKVKKGDVLCIIEAMKVLNEVTAEADGEVLEICVADGDLVEFGSCLMRIG